MGSWMKAEEARAFKCLLALALMYAIMAFAAYTVVHMSYVRPLPEDASPARFSEGRVLSHLRRLTVDIDGRQEGRPGLEEAAQYIKGELEAIKNRSGPEYRVEVDEALVSGSFNMIFLRHSISLAYRGHKNILLRIASNSSNDDDPSVLLNGHFDSPVGSTGAGDCGSCVASMLELARLVVDSNWIPPKPIIFLFNGAEELFLLGSHGFVKTHKWRDTVGAFINLEASGTGGLDLVCQSGPGSWPASIYVQAAKYPMANSVAQDVFGVIPGDTDFRILAEDYSNIPGLDIIFVLGGYYYHTSYDTIERLLPGSIQARGENIIRLLDAFASSAKLLDAKQRKLEDFATKNSDDRAVYFDYLSLFMIFYSRKTALLLHNLPAVIFLFMPLLLQYPNITLHSWLAAFFALIKGMLIHATSIILAIILPVVFSVLRLLLSSHAMSWFARPYLAFLTFIPSALMGLFIPRVIWRSLPVSQKAASDKLPIEVLSDETFFWGAFGLYAFMTVAYLQAGLEGGYLTYVLSSSMLISWFFFRLTKKHFGDQSFKSLAGYVIPSIPCVTYSVYFGGFFVQFVIEKMGMMGSLPPPFGFFVPDAIVAAIVGVVTGWCMGPILPLISRWLARPLILRCLLQLSVLGLAISSQFFPYSTAAPKRVVLQHTVRHADANKIVDSSFEFSVVDANSLTFLFKNSPEAAKILNIGSDFSFKADHHSTKCSWVALFPVAFLFSGSLKFPAPRDDVYEQYNYLPYLSVDESASLSTTRSRRVHLDLNLGSLKEVWVTVLNITGPLSNWSFADNKLPAPESMDSGPPSYICRLSGRSHEKWTFWLEANSSEALRVDLAVLDQHIFNDTRKLKGLFPTWVDTTTFSSFLSTYYF
ncbi:endoplasmic reticulum metallopeptidase 1 isoform X2 [Phalaenopsis equestris]|uniref:endoplasmic reticulum metallopeptidase 1 isoform X2 n=1 Tax=Phalaenopsis equestris TaxID=78828 RepID=UPI0009E56C04|nr:endoplasmic reticulum metallopeptidase 1 isoform X2 [Phalaenopsis equestris]